MEEEEGRGAALTGHRHPNPIADCSQTVRASRKGCREERRGKEKRMEISQRRARDEEKEEKKRRNVQAEKETDKLRLDLTPFAQRGPIAAVQCVYAVDRDQRRSGADEPLHNQSPLITGRADPYQKQLKILEHQRAVLS